MSTGISMSSVNKIKELANNGDYSLALDILEHQDLSKSLSPQFIRICGEVYYENGLYTEARNALVRAHSMAPAGNKIIYSLIKLYLSMGLRQLAEHYFEIYKFNQDKKDAGTYRIEYMIAKAYHKPVNELYSILVSANDIETSEIWDYEMLLLHAYIRNKTKFDSAVVEFKAKYRNSSRLSTLDDLLSDKVDLESMLYVFPCENKTDDAPEQEAVRKQEKKILEEDDLKIHPKDAKIMIMVEDDAPVSSTMKFKQMWIRSKDKKEQKRELKREENEERDKKDKKKSRGLWGIMSKKEEKLVDQEMQEIQSEEIDKEKLLDEVVAGNDNTTDSSDSSVGKTPDESSVVNKADVSNGEETANNQDMSELSADMIADEDVAVYSEDQSDSGEDDSFVIEEEPEDIVMVDADIFSKNEDEADETAATDISNEDAEETFDPEFTDEDDSFLEAENYNISDEIQIKDDDLDVDKDSDKDSDESLDESSDEFLDEKAGNFPDEAPNVQAGNQVGNETENKPEAENQSETENEPEIETFDFDKAFESLEEFDIYDEEIVDIQELDVEPDIEAEEDSQTDDDIESQEAEENPPQADDIENQEAEENPQTDDIENQKAEENPQTDDIENQEAEENPQTDDIENWEVEENQVSDIEDFEDIFEGKDVTDGKDILETVDIFETEETEDIIDIDKMDDCKSDNKGEDHLDTMSAKHSDFPIFKSSLFPDYNTDGAKLYDVKEHRAPQIESEEKKISENLQKEEDLIGETDRLLARLGIKLDTEFKSILSFDDTDESSEVTDENSGDENAGQSNQGDSADADNKEDSKDFPDDEKAEKESKKKKKSFKLKD